MSRKNRSRDKPRETGQSVAAPKTSQEQVFVAERTELSFSGPLPPPGVLAAYDEISAGLANRIVTLAEAQSSHRQGMEKSYLTGTQRSELLGQIFGLLISILGIGCGTYVILKGQSVVGSVLFGATLVGLVTVFIVGRQGKQRELERKRAVANTPPRSIKE